MSFVENVKLSFTKVKEDIYALRGYFSALQSNFNEWIVYLKTNQTELKERVEYLEKRLNKLERDRVVQALEPKQKIVVY